MSEIITDGKDSQPRNASRGVRKPGTGPRVRAEQQRFFLVKPGGGHGALELGKEFLAEAEAMVESFKTGLNYFVLSEWRAVADFSGRKPQLAREAVRIVPKTG